MTQSQIKITQRIPFPGKLNLKENIQRLKTDEKSYALKKLALNIKKDVSSLWWELYRIDSILELIERERATLKKIIELTNSKYEAGSGLQSDVLLAQLELTKLIDKEIEFKTRMKDTESRLLFLLGKKEGCIDIKRPKVVRLAKIKDMESLKKEALLKNPSILEKETVLKRKNFIHKLKKREYYPDFSLTGAYGKRFGTNPNGDDRADFLTFMVSLNIPIFFKAKQGQEVVSALERAKAIENELRDEKIKVKDRLSGLFSTYKGLLKKDALYTKSIIPKAESTLNALKTSYTAGRADILGLLRAELTLYRFKEAHINVLSRAKKIKAEIYALIGRSEEEIK